jgi:methionine-R-sulfoxide reductase
MCSTAISAGRRWAVTIVIVPASCEKREERPDGDGADAVTEALLSSRPQWAIILRAGILPWRAGMRRWHGITCVGIIAVMALGGCDRTREKKKTETTVKVKVFNKGGQLVGPIEMATVVKTDAEWRAQLTPAQFQIARGKGTERAFCGTLLDNKRHGVYSCVCCGLPLFGSDSKFNSGTGWPSFFQPVAKENVVTTQDRGHGMVRTEILCARCDCHLGHVFEDGPPPTGLRFCVNSESLVFTDEKELAKLADPAADGK